MDNERIEELKKIRDEIWKLTDSPLYEYRIQNNYYPVIGEGNHFAKIIFIGEAPGENEAKTARPFCGAAGRILDQLLESADIKREDVYITNIIKDRPPGNRDPNPDEIELYSPFLVRQIDIIKPKVVATLGRFSMDFIMRLFDLEDKIEPISKIHGKIFDAKASYGEIKIIPLYHPAVVVYNSNQLSILIKDFNLLKQFYKNKKTEK
ncbi:MAG: uracil-DNA glycosylase [Patescibacteria group bacterium]|nr:uracil-DNA glycosylase [Patescibacteria group bacterium]